MVTAPVRKSLKDLTGRPARTALSVLTLAIAVASVWFLAIPSIIDDAMQDEVRTGRLADVTVGIAPIELSDADLAALQALPNVAAADGRAATDVRVLIGDRRAPARVIGVRDFEDQSVDLARVESGAFPADGEVLSDVQNANVGVYDGTAGDTVEVVGAGDAAGLRLTVSGRGRTLPGGEQVQDENVIVLYATPATLADLGADPGVSTLAFRLDDTSPAAAATTVEAIRAQLEAVEGFGGFRDLPAVRAPGDWPAKSDTEQFAQLLSVITVLALLSAVVLIANTMSTLVAEQTRQVAVMRAIGARRRDVAVIYLRTTMLLGALGAVVGCGLGLVMANALASSFGQQFWAIDVGFGVDPTVLAVSLMAGLLAPPVAALPAIRRSLRVDLREGLEATGSTVGAEGRLPGLLRHATLLPRTAQIGLRNAGRRARRSMATAGIVALAVGNLLAVLAMSEGATAATQSSWGDHLEDVQLSTAGAAPFDDQAAATVLETPGVVEAEPVLKSAVTLGASDAVVWAMELEPLFRYRIEDGRWFEPEEVEGAAAVAVVEENIAELEQVEVGDTITLGTANGDVELDVVGIAGNQQENGTAVFVPLPTAQRLGGPEDGARTYWVKTDSSDEADIDRTTAALEDRLAAEGYEVTTEIRYVAERDEISANRSITLTIAVLGFVIVAISLVGLANAMTTNVLERTREIGILRSLGARARDVRRIFTSEGLALAGVGWLVGIPLGYLLTRLLVWLIWQVLEVRIPVVFPLANVALALVGTIVLALLVLLWPVRRAVRFRPGDALRYS